MGRILNSQSTFSLGVNEAGITLSDVITDNVSISMHGFMPKLPNNAGYVFQGNGVWTAIDTDGTLTANSDTRIPSQKAVKTFVQSLYPVGSIYISTVATNPATLFGFGTWSAFAAGRTLIGVGTSDQAFAAAATGGESNHTLTGAESGEKGHIHNYLTDDNGSSTTSLVMNHTGTSHNVATFNSASGGLTSGSEQAIAASGATNAHNNLPPYIVTYMWVRNS